MSLFLFLTVVQAIIAAALVAVILVQRSEGGGLGMGGNPSGLMSARGAADFMTRATAILATLFVVLSIALAAVAVGATSGREIDTSLDRNVTPASSNPLDAVQPAPAAPATGQPSTGEPATGQSAPAAPVDPLASPAN